MADEPDKIPAPAFPPTTINENTLIDTTIDGITTIKDTENSKERVLKKCSRMKSNCLGVVIDPISNINIYLKSAPKSSQPFQTSPFVASTGYLKKTVLSTFSSKVSAARKSDYIQCNHVISLINEDSGEPFVIDVSKSLCGGHHVFILKHCRTGGIGSYLVKNERLRFQDTVSLHGYVSTDSYGNPTGEYRIQRENNLQCAYGTDEQSWKIINDENPSDSSYITHGSNIVLRNSNDASRFFFKNGAGIRCSNDNDNNCNNLKTKDLLWKIYAGQELADETVSNVGMSFSVQTADNEEAPEIANKEIKII